MPDRKYPFDFPYDGDWYFNLSNSQFDELEEGIGFSLDDERKENLNRIVRLYLEEFSRYQEAPNADEIVKSANSIRSHMSEISKVLKAGDATARILLLGIDGGASALLSDQLQNDLHATSSRLQDFIALIEDNPFAEEDSGGPQTGVPLTRFLTHLSMMYYAHQPEPPKNRSGLNKFIFKVFDMLPNERYSLADRGVHSDEAFVQKIKRVSVKVIEIDSRT